MSDTPTSVSLSKTPAARPAPITTTESRPVVATQRTRMHAAHVRVTRVHDCVETTVDEFLRTFLRQTAVVVMLN